MGIGAEEKQIHKVAGNCLADAMSEGKIKETLNMNSSTIISHNMGNVIRLLLRGIIHCIRSERQSTIKE
jgi:hypothetical protein